MNSSLPTFADLAVLLAGRLGFTELTKFEGWAFTTYLPRAVPGAQVSRALLEAVRTVPVHTEAELAAIREAMMHLGPPQSQALVQFALTIWSLTSPRRALRLCALFALAVAKLRPSARN